MTTAPTTTRSTGRSRTGTSPRPGTGSSSSSGRPLRPVPDTPDPAGAPAELEGEQPVENGGRRRIEIAGGPDAIRVLKAALGQGAIPDVYVTGGRPVRIERVSGTQVVDLDEDAPLPVTPTPVSSNLLAQLLALHTYTFRMKARAAENGSTEFYEDETTPGPTQLGAVLAGAEWPTLATLAGIIGTPVLRRDWSLLQVPGYDRASGLFLAPTVPLPPVPERPSPEQVAEARRRVVEDLLGDFEWEDPASLANFIAVLVTPFLRRPLKALVPLVIVTATMPSSGKSLLTALVGLLVGQQTVPWPADNDAELEKLITSTFTKQSGAVIFDNLTEGEVIGSPILANLLTNPVWSSRILGSTGMGSWANDRLWMATGNNLRVGGDIASRSVYIRLKPKNPHPEARTGFAIPDLQGWIMNPAHRSELLWWLLVLVADWVAAGTPRDTSTPPMRQFTPWAHGVGGFLAHHGIGGFLTNLSTVREMDEEDLKWAVFLAKWRQRLGAGQVRVKDVESDAEITHDFGREIDPWDGEFITDPRGRRPRTAQHLGRLLAGQVDRFHGDPPLVLRAVTDGHNKSRLYWVEEYTS